MSQRVWIASVLAAALSAVAVVAERSRSQEAHDPQAATPQQGFAQPQAEASGEFGGGFGGGGEFGGGMAGEAPQPKALPVPAVPRIWATEDSGETERLYQLFKDKVVSSVDFPEGTPLNEVLGYLSEECSVQIVLDTIATDELGIGADEPVTIHVKNIRLGQAMRRMLEPLELRCIVEDGVLVVTSEEEALSRLAVAVYDVRDLLLQGDFDSLQNLVTATVASDTWAVNGGGEAEIIAYPQRGSLVISQSTPAHEQIAGLLAALRATDFDPNAKPLNPPTTASGQSATPVLGCVGGSL